MNTNLESAKTICRSLALQHFGSTRFFDEDKMVESLKKHGYTHQTAVDAVLGVQADRIKKQK